ncbi:MAG: carbohydrate ABC transporter permease [Proteobacteria bacterium]|nr:carbohydrate ABC transporter permease [Pseudomonadota bacterium]NBY20151.1 carbohydrate ABC transporter permease [bacterium]
MASRLKDPKLAKRVRATLILLIPALLQAFPLIYLLCVSWKEGAEVIQYPPRLFPREINWVNYSEALSSAPLVRFLLNSALVATSITLSQLLTSILAAYALSRLEFKGQNVIMAIIVGTMMIPGEVTIIPNYFTLASWNWLNTYPALIVPFSVSGFGIFFLYQFFKTVPKELEEAAFLEGCSRMRFLFQFIVPLALPAISAFAIYSFVGAWNQYLWPLIVTQTTDMQTAQIGIGMFRSQNESMSWGVIMAATAMLISPTVFLFILTQKQFVRGITMSGIKG